MKENKKTKVRNMFVLFMLSVFMFLFLSESSFAGLDIRPLSVDIKIKDTGRLNIGNTLTLGADIKNTGPEVSDCKIYFVVKKRGRTKNQVFGPYHCKTLEEDEELTLEKEFVIRKRNVGEYSYKVVVRSGDETIERSRWEDFSVGNALFGKLSFFGEGVTLNFHYFESEKKLEVELYLDGTYAARKYVRLS